MASIRSRNGRYQVQVRRGGLGSRSRTFVLKQDAERWARKMEAQFDQGELQQFRTRDVLLHDLIDRYRQEITPAKKSRDQEGRRLARLMRDPIASLMVEKLTAHELALFRDRRIKDGIRTCQYDLVLIRHILEISRKEWNLGLAVNPVDQISGHRDPRMLFRYNHLRAEDVANKIHSMQCNDKFD